MARGTSSSSGPRQHGGDHRGRLVAGEATCRRRQGGYQPGEVVGIEPGDRRLTVGQAQIGGARRGSSTEDLPFTSEPSGCGVSMADTMNVRVHRSPHRTPHHRRFPN